MLFKDERGWRVPHGKISRFIYDGLVAGSDHETILAVVKKLYPDTRTTLSSIRITEVKIKGPKDPHRRMDERHWKIPRKGSIARVVYDGMVQSASYDEILVDAIAAFPDRSVTLHTVYSSSWRIRDRGESKYPHGVRPREPSANFLKLAEASRAWQEKNATTSA